MDFFKLTNFFYWNCMLKVVATCKIKRIEKPYGARWLGIQVSINNMKIPPDHEERLGEYRTGIKKMQTQSSILLTFNS